MITLYCQIKIMTIKEKDFIEIDYVGKIAETGEVFDTTKEDVAKQNPKQA